MNVKKKERKKERKKEWFVNVYGDRKGTIFYRSDSPVSFFFYELKIPFLNKHVF